MRIEERISCAHTVRCLHRAGIDTMEKLCMLTRAELMRLRGIGTVIADDLTRQITAYQAENQQSKTEEQTP